MQSLVRGGKAGSSFPLHVGSKFPTNALQPAEPQARQPAHRQQEAWQGKSSSSRPNTKSKVTVSEELSPFLQHPRKRPAPPCKASLRLYHPVHDAVPTAGPSMLRDNPTSRCRTGQRHPQPHTTAAYPSRGGPQLVSSMSAAAQMQGPPSPSQPELDALLRGLRDVCSSPP